MAAPVNLNRVRKQKARAAKAARADENALRHGLTKSQKSAAQQTQDKTARLLDGHRLDKGARDT